MAGCSASLWTGTSPDPFNQRSLAPGYSASPTQKQKVRDMYFFTWPALYGPAYTQKLKVNSCSLTKCFKLLEQTLDNL